jgi:hypothetical protein
MGPMDYRTNGFVTAEKSAVLFRGTIRSAQQFSQSHCSFANAIAFRCVKAIRGLAQQKQVFQVSVKVKNVKIRPLIPLHQFLSQRDNPRTNQSAIN